MPTLAGHRRQRRWPVFADPACMISVIPPGFHTPRAETHGNGREMWARGIWFRREGGQIRQIFTCNVDPAPSTSSRHLRYFATHFHSFFFLKILFVFRKRREGEREEEKPQCVVASHVPPTGDLTSKPGMCPDRESSQ